MSNLSTLSPFSLTVQVGLEDGSLAAACSSPAMKVGGAALLGAASHVPKSPQVKIVDSQRSVGILVWVISLQPRGAV